MHLKPGQKTAALIKAHEVMILPRLAPSP